MNRTIFHYEQTIWRLNLNIMSNMINLFEKIFQNYFDVTVPSIRQQNESPFDQIPDITYTELENFLLFKSNFHLFWSKRNAFLLSTNCPMFTKREWSVIIFVNRTLNSHFRAPTLLGFIFVCLFVTFLNKRLSSSLRNLINWCFSIVIQNLYFTELIISLLVKESLWISINFMLKFLNTDE